MIEDLWYKNSIIYTHRGSVTVVDAELYSRPQIAPPMLGAAVTASTAEFVGGWSDGLLTVLHQVDLNQRQFVEGFAAKVLPQFKNH
jgi:alkanesulfonate monooxygenase SsuD/methylene tetrahydromethanopterin reductase-like flavin-dependent oxidoreductase (luciferase family)